jgi:pimeloyl-ACP methyl ester carboxylesterase
MINVSANGIRFTCLEEGRGPLVLLLHGFPDTAHSWDALMPRLAAAGFRAVAPNMRGYAPTEIPARDTDLETLARDTLALIDALGEKDAIVIGYDWGATAAYGAAALDPTRVRRLIGVGLPHPAGLKITPRKVWGVRHFFTFKLPGAARRFAANELAALPALCKRWSPTWNPAPSEFDAVRACFSDPKSLDAALGYYRALPLSGRPPAHLRKKIDVPTLVFAGTDDPLISPDDFRAAARMFTKEYVVEEVPGGHFLHREHPDVFAERLLNQLTAKEARPRSSPA